MDKIEQIRAAHLAARPKPAVNPAWANAEHDIGVLLAEIERLRAREAELVNALTPFARATDVINIGYRVAEAHLAAAKAALSGSNGNG